MNKNSYKIKKLFPQYKRYDYKHSVCIYLIFVFILCTLLFFKVSAFRIVESVRDFINSICYYFCEIFGLEYNISPTVISIPHLGKDYYTFFPDTFEEFKNKLLKLGQLIINKDNIFSYFGGISSDIAGLLTITTICLPFILVAFILLRRALNRQNNDYNMDTLPLKVFKILSKFIYMPIKKSIKAFIYFIQKHNAYVKIFIFIWLFNLNFITIIIELFAFLFYFVASVDVLHIYTQIYKLFLDLSVAIRTIPIWIYALVGVYFFDRFRKKIGYARLRHFEMYDRGFINSLPIVSMVCGTMGKKKTTMLTDMALSQDVMFTI